MIVAAIVALAQRVAAEFKTLRATIATTNTAMTKYRPPIYVLEANQTSADIPADFPAGGLVFQKTS